MYSFSYLFLCTISFLHFSSLFRYRRDIDFPAGQMTASLHRKTDAARKIRLLAIFHAYLSLPAEVRANTVSLYPNCYFILFSKLPREINLFKYFIAVLILKDSRFLSRKETCRIGAYSALHPHIDQMKITG